MDREAEEKWLFEISPKKKLLDFNLKEIWQYRDLLMLFVKRDIVTTYKQTVLGPLWFFIRPIFTTVVFTIIFGQIAKLSTDGVPQVLFYLSGSVAWNYFSECFSLTSDTFKKNESIFSKVYFPRLIMPLSVVISNLGKFFIQLGLFLAVLLYFIIKGSHVSPNTYILLLPFLVLLMAGLGLGGGMVISSLTTKYRDLTFLVTFGVSLLMYASPVVVPYSEAKNTAWGWFMKYNPLTPILESFKYGWLGVGTFDAWGILYSTVFTIVLLITGLLIFNRTEKSFIDTV